MGRREKEEAVCLKDPWSQGNAENAAERRQVDTEVRHAKLERLGRAGCQQVQSRLPGANVAAPVEGPGRVWGRRGPVPGHGLARP